MRRASRSPARAEVSTPRPPGIPEPSAFRAEPRIPQKPLGFPTRAGEMPCGMHHTGRKSERSPPPEVPAKLNRINSQNVSFLMYRGVVFWWVICFLRILSSPSLGTLRRGVCELNPPPSRAVWREPAPGLCRSGPTKTRRWRNRSGGPTHPEVENVQFRGPEPTESMEFLDQGGTPCQKYQVFQDSASRRLFARKLAPRFRLSQLA